MGAPLSLRTDYSAEDLRGLAVKARDANQSRRLLSLAAVREGFSRAQAAALGGMDRQSLRDWVVRFNAAGPDGLIDRKSAGRKPRLTPDQLTELRQIVEAGPEFEKDGVVRWRCVDLKQVIETRWGVFYCERSVGKILKRLGFTRLSARPRAHDQDAAALEGFKKRLCGPHRRHPREAA